MQKKIGLKIFFLLSIVILNNIVFAQENSSDEYYRLAKIESKQKRNYWKAAFYCKKSLELSPNNYDVHELLGKCYLELKKYDSARYELKKVTDKYPHNEDARNYLINVETTTGRYSSAICYVNELLEIKPYSKSLWLKKISLYNEMGNKIEAKKSITRLYNIYPNDTAVTRYYRNFMQEEAEMYYKRGNFTKSKEILDKVIENNSRDLPSIHKLVNTNLSAGKKSEALNTIDLGLANYPSDPILIEKKIGLLQEQGNYGDAISFTENILKKYPSAKLRSTLNDLKLESARYYNNSDPYVLYQKIYAQNPGNEEAFNYLLNNSISKGYYSDAEDLLKTALKRNPNNKNILLKQLLLFETQGNTEETKKAIEKLAIKYPSDNELQSKYANILFSQAKGYFQDQLYRPATQSFEKLTRNPEYRNVANEYLFSIDLAQKNYPFALNRINRLIASSPRNEDYIFKKSSLLEEMGNYEEAIKLTQNLYRKNPQNNHFKNVIVSQSMPFIKQLIETEKYDTALTIINSLLESDPTNSVAYNYAININSQIKEYNKGIDYCDRALEYYPNSKDFRLKKADLFFSLKDYEKSSTLLENLHNEFPYNENIKSSLTESLFQQGKKYENVYYTDSAIYYYSKSFAISPKDTYSLYRLINLSLENKNYDSSKIYIDRGLAIFPENNQLLFKKGELYEINKQYDSAYQFIKKAEPAFSNATYQNYLNYLLSKSYHNQAGVYFVRSFFDSTQLKSSIATFEYTRYQLLNTYTFRFNYAARPVGTGIQHELDWFHKFNKSYYLQTNIAFANKLAFPKLKMGLSLFKSLKYNWEGEVGARYVLQKDNNSMSSVVVGLAKSWDEVWINVRGFVLSDFNKIYNTLLLQSRYYFNYKNDYIAIMGAIGTSPEDKTLDYQLNSFVNYSTKMVGAGFQHKIKHRSTIGIQGNWYNYQLKSDYYYNQYNLQITLLTKF